VPRLATCFLTLFFVGKTILIALASTIGELFAFASLKAPAWKCGLARPYNNWELADVCRGINGCGWDGLGAFASALTIGAALEIVFIPIAATVDKLAAALRRGVVVEAGDLGAAGSSRFGELADR
jgi:hypothetical protein